MEVFVTPKAERNFDDIVAYIQTKWGKNTATSFIQKVDHLFMLLKSHPNLGKTEINDIRGIQLSPQTRILYRIRTDKIIVLAFFDVRQDPDKK